MNIRKVHNGCKNTPMKLSENHKRQGQRGVTIKGKDGKRDKKRKRNYSDRKKIEMRTSYFIQVLKRIYSCSVIVSILFVA